MTSLPAQLGRSLLLLAFLLMCGCQGGVPAVATAEPEASPWFADVTDEVGLDFTHDAGSVDGRYLMPQAMGSGAALFDFDGDGRLDIYLIHNGGPQGKKNQLFHQEPDGRFTDVSAGSGLDVAGPGMGVAIGDVNNDGWPDVLLTEYGRIRLFLNNHNGTFTDVTKDAGLENPMWGASAAFFDYDRDGWLDLVVVNYVNFDPTWPCSTGSGQPDYCAPRIFPGRVTRLFHNIRAHGDVHFVDVTQESGLVQLTGPGLGVLCADFDGDGWPDIFVANDGQPNRLWINRHDGTFADEAVRRGVACNAMGQAEANMGVAYADVDGDGLADLFVTHLTDETNTLWRQGPRGLFQDRTAACGLAGTQSRGTGFGTVLGDFDQDGAPDLAVVNGRISRGRGSGNPALGPHWGMYAEHNRLFANDGNGRFRDISAENAPLCGSANVGRGLVAGVLGDEGALDLLVTCAGGRARLYRNVIRARGHWLLVRAVDPGLGGRDAYGAEVRVCAGGREWVRLVNPAGSYLCSGDARAHFGLGQAASVDGIDVLWPDGTRESFPGGPADRKLELARGAGTRLASRGAP
jgi:hypothetical protein